MAKRPATIIATIDKVLLYFDEPLVILLNGNQSHKSNIIVASAISREDMDQPFFACRVNRKNWEEYLNCKVDLYYLFANASTNEYYFFDLYAEENDVVKLIKASDAEVKNNDFWPGRGFFSSSHNEFIDSSKKISITSQCFNINGAWDTMDFSRFYNKISNIYAISCLKNIKNSELSQKKLAKIVSSRSWSGGGSYSRFYKNTVSNEIINSLKVKSVQFASPGQIELLGDENIFKGMVGSLTMFGQNIKETSKSYHSIDETLEREKLKTSRSSDGFLSHKSEIDVKKHADFILKSIGINDHEMFLVACNNNILTYSKIVLSIYRVIKEFYKFIAEGRVQISMEKSSNTN